MHHLITLIHVDISNFTAIILLIFASLTIDRNRGEFIA